MGLEPTLFLIGSQMPYLLGDTRICKTRLTYLSLVLWDLLDTSSVFEPMEGLEPPMFIFQLTRLVLSPLNHIGII